MMPFLFIHRCETESRLHYPSTWRCWTHDCGDAYEEHDQSSEERSAVSAREDSHGSCVLMSWSKFQQQRHIPLPQSTTTPLNFYLKEHEELPLHMNWKDDGV